MLTASCACIPGAGSSWLPWRPEGDGVLEFVEGPAQPGTVGLSGVEEEMVSDAVRLLRKGVRHFLAFLARCEWG